MNRLKVANAAEDLLKALFGEKIGTDENFKGTSLRMAKAYEEILGGEEKTEQQIAKILSKSKRFPSKYGGSICCPNHNTYSMCPHHLLPVAYKVSVLYMPEEGGKVVGASKLGRMVDVLAKRAVLQETFVEEIIQYLDKYLSPKGIGVFVQGVHSCMQIRGLKTQGSFTMLKLTGVYKELDRCRSEAMALLRVR